MWPFTKKQKTAKQQEPQVRQSVATRAYNYAVKPVPALKRQDEYSGDDFLTGMAVGGIIGGTEGAVLGGIIGGVEGGIIGGEIAAMDNPAPEPIPTVEFGGGESGGAGASSSWDSPPCESTPDTSSSYDSGSSSSDCGSSSDSGSSSSDF